MTRIPVLLALSCVAALGQQPLASGAAMAAEAAVHSPAAKVETIAGSPYRRIVLSERAAQRLGVRTEEVVQEAGSIVVPYSALVYDVTGRAYVYTSPMALTFIRQPVAVARIAGNRVVLSDGPAPGTRIATLGVPQLYGAEKGVGH